MEKRIDLKVGDTIIYVDQFGQPHNALVTIVWGGLNHPSYQSEWGHPGCNLVYVSGDPTKEDSYGTQIERETSVVHKTKQPAHGRFWRWPDEE